MKKRMVKNGKRPYELDLLSEGMGAVGPRIPTWLFRILVAIPGAASGLHKFLKFCQNELEWRVNNKNAEGGQYFSPSYHRPHRAM